MPMTLPDRKLVTSIFINEKILFNLSLLLETEKAE